MNVIEVIIILLAYFTIQWFFRLIVLVLIGKIISKAIAETKTKINEAMEGLKNGE